MSERREQKRVPLMSGGVPRVELDGSAKLVVRVRPVPVMNESAPGQRRVRLGEIVVQRDRFQCIRLCALESFMNRNASIIDVQRMTVGESRVRQRVRGVFGNGLLEVSNPGAHTVLCAPVPLIPSLEIKAVRAEARRVAL